MTGCGSGTIFNLVTSFMRDESGVTVIEYGLIATLVSVALIGGASRLGHRIGDHTFIDIARLLVAG